MRQYPVEAVIDGIHVHGDGHAGAAGDSGGVLHRLRIVSVDMQQPAAGDLLRRDLRWLDAQAIVAAPEDGALARGPVDDDVRRLIGATLAHLHVFQIDACSLQAFHLDSAALVIAQGPDIFGLQPEAGAGDHGAGHLAAGAEDLLLKRRFSCVGREVRHHQKCVGGVQADPHHVESRCLVHG